MNNHVTFETSQFNKTEVQPNFINPHCFGEDVALWLQADFSNRGFSASEPIQEDWCWELEVQSQSHGFWLNIGLLEDDSAWLIWVEPQNKLFRKIPEVEVLRLCGILNGILRSSPGISNIRWYDQVDWVSGRVNYWSPSPEGAG
jgi:hypothetical protein